MVVTCTDRGILPGVRCALRSKAPAAESTALGGTHRAAGAPNAPEGLQVTSGVTQHPEPDAGHVCLTGAPVWVVRALVTVICRW